MVPCEFLAAVEPFEVSVTFSLGRVGSQMQRENLSEREREGGKKEGRGREREKREKRQAV